MFSHNTYLLYSFYTQLSLQSQTFPQIDNNKLKLQRSFFCLRHSKLLGIPFHQSSTLRGFREPIFLEKKNELLLQTTSQFLTPSTINRIFFSAAFSRCPELLEYSLVDYIKYVCYARCRVYKLLPRNKMGFYTVHIYKIICNSRCI